MGTLGAVIFWLCIVIPVLLQACHHQWWSGGDLQLPPNQRNIDKAVELRTGGLMTQIYKNIQGVWSAQMFLLVLGEGAVVGRCFEKCEVG